ncbi:MAG: sulfite exporter TauE/SafE family protein [Anaerolineales bacterium]|nr:sulfite exporter TauE/SafE family protein [Anaerolineales bacterium]MBP6208386.1 sulfite exporter TauE/SafE family protein [Anaerolineales bacterium]
MNLFVAFITGLTTGGLGCLAVQGGLLTSTLAHQIEQDMLAHNGSGSTSKFKPHIAQPILLFLLAKLIAYTILGYLLGSLGMVLQLTPLMSAILYFAIGIFMIGNGLRMFNVHPIFRFFVIEPPSSLTRYIRRKSKNGTSFFTPILLGTLTLFLPCGVTQAMMATALGTGSPTQGAMLMFSFILGTSPLFFSVAYFATRLGSAMEKNFTRIVAVTMLIMGLVQVDTGLNLSGAPFSISRTISIVQAYALPAQTGTSIEVTENGYFPQVLHLPANQEVSIEWVTRNTQACSRSVVVPDLEYQKILPTTGRVTMDIPAQEKGAIIRYTCSMGMYPSQFVFDLEE